MCIALSRINHKIYFVEFLVKDRLEYGERHRVIFFVKILVLNVVKKL